MNRERAKELLPIFEAYANGEDIQRQYGGLQGSYIWKDSDLLLADDGYIYRIKPSPREFWVKTSDYNADKPLYWYTADDDEPARSEYFKVREVLE